MIQIDGESRKTIVRFGVKLAFALAVSTFTGGPFLTAAARWLTFSALVTMAVGIALRERVARALNHWDEVLALTGTSMIFMILDRFE